MNYAINSLEKLKTDIEEELQRIEMEKAIEENKLRDVEWAIKKLKEI